MATGDNRRIIQAATLDLPKINEALRHISEWITRLEGRSGEVRLRDSLTLQTEKQTAISIEAEEGGQAAIAVFGTDNASLALCKGATKEPGGEWVATDTTAVLWVLARDGTGTLYVDSGLTVGQAFSPTSAFVVSTGGSVAGHALVGSAHTASGLTIGHVLQATSATAFAFGALAGTNVSNTPAGSIASTTVQAAINELDTEKAALASPTFTGTPAAPTAAVGTSTTQLATTAFVDAEAVAKAGDTMTGDLLVTSATTVKPVVEIRNTNGDATAPYLILSKQSASPANSDETGRIQFKGFSSTGVERVYSQIYGVANNVTNAVEGGVTFHGDVNSGTVGLSMYVGGSNVYVYGDCSALTYTDRTPYPASKTEAYDIIKSMEGKNGKVDKIKMHPSITKIVTKYVEDLEGKIKAEPEIARDLSMTVSSLVEIIKDLILRIEELEKK